jgi:ABC-type lipopolysaccharide export system ATPase subunit
LLSTNNPYGDDGLPVATRGYVLQRGGVLLEGTSEQLLEAPGVRAAYLGGSV